MALSPKLLIARAIALQSSLSDRKRVSVFFHGLIGLCGRSEVGAGHIARAATSHPAIASADTAGDYPRPAVQRPLRNRNLCR
jgi:hypothetical protein